MKKKVLMAILPLCVAMTMTACGGNTDTTEVGETTATEENAEVDVQAEVPMEDEKPKEPGQTVEEQEDEATVTGDTNVESEDSEAEEYEFNQLVSDAVSQDKSADYGVNSTSSYDVSQFINGDGSTMWDVNGKEYEEFSGRFAFPELSPSDIFDHAIIYYRTDSGQYISVWHGDSEKSDMLSMLPGSSFYNNDLHFVDSIVEYTVPFSVDTIDGSIDVVSRLEQSESYPDWVMNDDDYNFIDEDGNILEYNDEGDLLDKDGNVIEPIRDTTYFYEWLLGDFTITFQGRTQYTQEQIQEIADSIHLIGNAAE